MVNCVCPEPEVVGLKKVVRHKLQWAGEAGWQSGGKCIRLHYKSNIDFITLCK